MIKAIIIIWCCFWFYLSDYVLIPAAEEQISRVKLVFFCENSSTDSTHFSKFKISSGLNFANQLENLFKSSFFMCWKRKPFSPVCVLQAIDGKSDWMSEKWFDRRNNQRAFQLQQKERNWEMQLCFHSLCLSALCVFSCCWSRLKVINMKIKTQLCMFSFPV